MPNPSELERQAVSDPLTPERLEEIRHRAEHWNYSASCYMPYAHTDLLALLAEADRLRGERDRLLAFMDGVRDLARNRNPDGATLLDFLACWNEQSESQVKRLRAALEEICRHSVCCDARHEAKKALEAR